MRTLAARCIAGGGALLAGEAPLVRHLLELDVELKWTRSSRNAHSQSSRTRFETATRSIVREEESTERQQSSFTASPFLSTCDGFFCSEFIIVILPITPPPSDFFTAFLNTSVLMPSVTAATSRTSILASGLRSCVRFFSGLHQSSVRMSSLTHTRRSCGGPSAENFKKMLPARSSPTAVSSWRTIALITRPRWSFCSVTTCGR